MFFLVPLCIRSALCLEQLLLLVRAHLSTPNVCGWQLDGSGAGHEPWDLETGAGVMGHGAALVQLV